MRIPTKKIKTSHKPTSYPSVSPAGHSALRSTTIMGQGGDRSLRPASVLLCSSLMRRFYLQAAPEKEHSGSPLRHATAPPAARSTAPPEGTDDQPIVASAQVSATEAIPVAGVMSPSAVGTTPSGGVTRSGARTVTLCADGMSLSAGIRSPRAQPWETRGGGSLHARQDGRRTEAPCHKRRHCPLLWVLSASSSVHGLSRCISPDGFQFCRFCGQGSSRGTTGQGQDRISGPQALWLQRPVDQICSWQQRTRQILGVGASRGDTCTVIVAAGAGLRHPSTRGTVTRHTRSLLLPVVLVVTAGIQSTVIDMRLPLPTVPPGRELGVMAKVLKAPPPLRSLTLTTGERRDRPWRSQCTVYRTRYLRRAPLLTTWIPGTYLTTAVRYQWHTKVNTARVLGRMRDKADLALPRTDLWVPTWRLGGEGDPHQELTSPPSRPHRVPSINTASQLQDFLPWTHEAPLPPRAAEWEDTQLVRRHSIAGSPRATSSAPILLPPQVAQGRRSLSPLWGGPAALSIGGGDGQRTTGHRAASGIVGRYTSGWRLCPGAHRASTKRSRGPERGCLPRFLLDDGFEAATCVVGLLRGWRNARNGCHHSSAGKSPPHLQFPCRSTGWMAGPPWGGSWQDTMP